MTLYRSKCWVFSCPSSFIFFFFFSLNRVRQFPLRVWTNLVDFLPFFNGKKHLSQRTTKPTIILIILRPAKIQIRAVWSESSLITCAFYSLRVMQRGINDDPWHTVWMYRLIWVFAGHTGLVVGSVVRWLICNLLFASMHIITSIEDTQVGFQSQSIVCQWHQEEKLTNHDRHIHTHKFICVEVLRPNQPNRVMSSAVSLLGRLSHLSG